MPCTESARLTLRSAALVLALLLAACAGRPPGPVHGPAHVPAHAPSPAHSSSTYPEVTVPLAQAPAAQPSHAVGAARHSGPPRYVKLGPPKAPRSLDELRLQAAQRLVAAHPDSTYVGTPPSVLLAIPILEVELHADGSVRHIKVIRVPGQAQDTVQAAIAAVHRAAPFGDVSKLKKPWKFVETFLFDDERRFMPRTLDR